MLFSLDYCMYHCYILPQPCSSRACSRDDPEDGARRGVPRRRLVTVGLGRHGTPPARHYDLAARSSLNGSGAMPEKEARDRSPKSPRCERREAGVPRYGTQGASPGAWPAALCAGPTGASQAHASLGAPLPLFSGARSQKAKPGRKKRAAGTRWAARNGDDSESRARHRRPHPEECEGATSTADSSELARVSNDEDGRGYALILREASQRTVALERPALAARCDALQH